MGIGLIVYHGARLELFGDQEFFFYRGLCSPKVAKKFSRICSLRSEKRDLDNHIYFGNFGEFLNA